MDREHGQPSDPGDAAPREGEGGWAAGFPLPIRYFGDLNTGTGYNVALRGYLLALRSLGITEKDVRLVAAFTSDHEQEAGDWVSEYEHGCEVRVSEGRYETRDFGSNVVHLPPHACGQYMTPGMHNIAITAWETSHLPTSSVQREGVGTISVANDLSRFDEVWVPTRHVKRVLEVSGVGSAIHVIPHALLQRCGVVSRPETRFSFYTVGTWNARKDIAKVLRAYLRCGWTIGDPVSLSMYCVPPSRDMPSVNMHGIVVHQAIRGTLEALPNKADCPQWDVHTIYVSMDKAFNRPGRHHCFVSASHGEGFCLPALEAAAAGCWVIGGGPWLEDLADVAGCIADGGPLDLLPTKQIPITPMPEVIGYQLDHKWWDVEEQDLIDAMRAAYEAWRDGGWSADEATSRGELVARAYSTSRVGGKIMGRFP